MVFENIIRKVNAAIALIFLALMTYEVSGQGNVPDLQEYDALRSLFESTNGQNWTNNSGWPYTNWPASVPSSQFESWSSPGINVTNGDVVYIVLATNNMSGPLPSQISQLTDVYWFNFNFNSLTSMPSLSGMSNLRTLMLDENPFNISMSSMVGKLPTSMEQLHLRNTGMSGSIPSAIGSYTNLYTLLLSDNQISGSLPSGINNMAVASFNTTTLTLDGNNLTDISVLQSHPNKSVLNLDVRYNRLDFGDLEPFFTPGHGHPFQDFDYIGQQPIGSEGSYAVKPGGTLTIPFSTGGSNNSYSWVKDNGPMTISTSLQLVINDFQASDAGTYKLYVSNSKVPIEQLESYDQTVILLTPPTLTDIEFCTGNDATLSTPSSGIIRWYTSETGGSPFATGNSVTVTPPGEITYWASRELHGVESDRAPIALTFGTPPTVEIIGSTETTVTVGQNVTLRSDATNWTEWYWEGFPPGTIHTVNHDDPGVYVYTVVASNACTSVSATKTVTVLPVHPTVSDVSVCYGQTATLSTEDSGIIRWYDWGHPATRTLLHTGPTFTTGTITYSTYFYVSRETQGFESAAIKVDVNVTGSPTVSIDQGSSMSITIGDQITLSATADAQTYSWDNGLGDGQTHTFTPSVEGSYVYTVTATNECNLTDQTSITVNVLPLPPVVTDVTICGFSPGEAATLSTGDTGVIRWYDAETGGNVVYTGNPVTTSALTATTNFWASREINGVESLRSRLQVLAEYPLIGFSFFPGPDGVCPGTTVTLGSGAQQQLYSEGIWHEGTDTNGPVVGIGDDVQVTLNDPGHYYFTQAVTNACGLHTAIWDITVKELPIVDAGPDLDLCSLESPLDLTQLSVTPVFGTLGARFLIGGIEITSFDPSLYGIGTHTIEYYYKQEFTTLPPWPTTCPNSDFFDITVFDPVVTVPDPVSRCEYDPDLDLNTLAGITPPGGIFLEGGVEIPGGIFHINNGNIGSHTISYQYEFSSGCVVTEDFTVTVNGVTDLILGDLLSLCHNDPVYNLYDDINVSTGVFSGDIVSNLFDPQNFTPGQTYTFTFTHTNAAGCISTGTRDVEVKDLPEVNAGNPIELCSEQIPYDLSLEATPGGGIFSGIGVNGNFFDPQDPAVAAGNTYQIVYSYTAGNGCTVTSTRDVTVVRPPLTVPASPIIYCENQITNIDLFSYVTPLTGTFYNSTNEVITGGNFVVPDVTSITDYTIRYEVNYETEYDAGCIIDDTFIITINPIVDILSLGDPLTVCENKAPIDLLADVQLSGSALPEEGSFSGVGVENNIFSPADVGPGIYTVTYTYVTPQSCTSTATRQIEILDNPSVFIGGTLELCEDEDIYDLMQDVVVEGGILPMSRTEFISNGGGLSGSEFNPQTENLGENPITITFQYTTPDGCLIERSRWINVISPEFVVPATVEVCENSNPVPLSTLDDFTPLGGVFRDGNGDVITESAFIVGSDLSLTYEYDFGRGCLKTQAFTLHVNPSTPIDAGPDLTLCLNDASEDLADDVDVPGGTFSGVGVEGNFFNPQVAGATQTLPFTFQVTYTVINGYNCESTDVRNITVNPVPVIDAGPDVTLCSHETVLYDLNAEVTLPLGGLLTDGEWLDENDIPLGASTFDPNGKPLGDYILKFSYTDPGTGCTSVDEIVITVNEPDLLDISGLDICDEGNPINLTHLGGIFEFGGSFSGLGVSGPDVNDEYFFTPEAAFLTQSPITITYTVDFGRGCVLSEPFTIEVFDELPAPTIGGDFTLCRNDSRVNLMADVQSGRKGGVFTIREGGLGINGKFFDPADAGVGVFTIDYVYTDPRNCSATNSRVITVNEIPDVTITGGTIEVCEEAASFSLFDGNVLPVGGSFSGPGVSGSNFNPTAAGPGLHNLVYTYTDGNSCSNTAVRSILVRAAPTASAGPNIFQCPTFTSVDITASGDPSYTYTWTSSAGTFNTQSINVTGLSTDTYFRLTVTDSFGCTRSYDPGDPNDDTDPMIMLVGVSATIPPPVAHIYNPNDPQDVSSTYEICPGENGVLRATKAFFGQRYLWYDSPSGGQPLNDHPTNLADIFTTPNPVYSNTPFYVSILCQDGGESTRTEVEVKVKEAVPVPDPGPVVVYKNLCEASVDWNPGATAPSAPITWYWQTTEGGTDMSEERQVENFVDDTTPINLLNDTYFLRAYDEVKGCWSEASQKIEFTPPVTLQEPYVFNVDGPYTPQPYIDDPELLDPCQDKIVELPPNTNEINYYFMETFGSTDILTTDRSITIDKSQEVYVRGRYKEVGTEIDCWTQEPITKYITVDRPETPVFQCFNFCVGQQMTIFSENLPNGGELEWFDPSGNPLGSHEFLDITSLGLAADQQFIFTARAYGPLPDRCPSKEIGQAVVRVMGPSICDENLNWIQFTAFSDDSSPNANNEIASNRQYFDFSGSPVQNQSKDYVDSDIIVSASIQDKLGRNAINTLPAPGLQSSFAYKSDFALTSSNAKYDYSHFQQSNSQSMASTFPGSLGWYYGAGNDIETNVPQSAIPFTRDVFIEDGSGNLLTTTLPGEQHQASGNNFAAAHVFGVTNELNDYLFYQNEAFPPGNDPQNLKGEAMQQVVRDENGIYSVTILDKEQKPLMATRAGSDLSVDAQVTLDAMQHQFLLSLLDIDANSLKIENTDYIEVYRLLPSESLIYSGHPNGFVVNTSQPVAIRSPQTFEVRYERLLNSFGYSSLAICSPCQSELRNTVTNYHNFYLLQNETLSFELGSVGDFEITDLLTGQDIEGINLDPGFYKITATQGKITMNYSNQYDHPAYNYYDDKDRLVTSITPNGVSRLKAGDPYADIDKTTYQYNDRDFLLSVTEPDGGTTNYLYRQDGSIRFSQNAEQLAGNRISYTNYDEAGRPIESGEYTSANLSDVNNPTDLEAPEDSWMAADPNRRQDWIRTTYDKTVALPSQLSTGYIQHFTSGAVSFTENKQVKTWYSYDQFGRVVWMVQEFQSFKDDADQPRTFTLDYYYDFEGNVQTVIFQKDIWYEAYWHHYEYDNNRRLIKVSTSLEGTDRYEHMAYEYYRHGPLKRALLARDPDPGANNRALQGIDYVYTLQGWLKSINHPYHDPGEDAITANSFADAFQTSLEYYNGDYNNSGNPIPSVDAGNFGEQFNGNIRSTVWSRSQQPLTQPAPLSLPVTDGSLGEVIAQGDVTLGDGFYTNGQDFSAVVNPGALILLDEPNDIALYNYAYDNEYQLLEAQFREGDLNDFTEKFRVSNLDYDENGNIKRLIRFDEVGVFKDNFTYVYDDGDNQLNSVPGYVNEYRYNAIGQLTHEIGKAGSSADLYIEYDVTGKVRALYEYNGGGTPPLADRRYEYLYDDRGFRIAKIAYDTDGTLIIGETWYVRDASGNIIATYAEEGANGEMIQTELPIYGNNRIGVSFRNPSRYKYNYELTDHLGNVRSVISRLKFMETATMEPENGPVEEIAYENVAETRHLATTGESHTGTHSAWLNGANTMSGGAIGPGKSLRVKAGDKVKMEVYAMYNDNALNPNLLAGWGALLTGAFGLTASGESAQAFNAISDLFGLGPIVPPQANNAVPKAYLQYLLFNDGYDHIDTGNPSYTKISTAAFENFQLLTLEVDIAADGYMYIFTANETDGKDVWFDDLTVTHLGIDITQNTDYYPFGSFLSHWQKPAEPGETPEDYRFGYQGQFAEEDQETGWNQFEARMYDPSIGRWLSVDPARVGFSPYVGMSNNPMNFLDMDGRIPINQIIYGYPFSISSPLGDRFHPIQNIWKLHRGIDVPAPIGTNLRSFASGTVTEVISSHAVKGNSITIDHGFGVVTKYHHLEDGAISVIEGLQVGDGTFIGKTGNTGLSTGPHLHLSMLVNGVDFDPNSVYDLQRAIDFASNLSGLEIINRIGSLNARLDILADRFAAGKLNEEVFNTRSQRLQNKIKDLRFAQMIDN